MFCSAFWCSCFPSVQASGVRHLLFFPYFALSNLQLLRAFVDLRVVFFVPSGFRAFGFHGFRVFCLRVFMFLVVVLPSCKLSGFLPLMFSSFRLSFFDLSPELSIVCSKFAFVSCFFAVVCRFVCFFSEIPNKRFYPCNNHFCPCNNHFFPCQRPFLKLFRLCLLLLMYACPELNFVSQIRLRNPKGKRLLGCLCVGRSGLV